MIKRFIDLSKNNFKFKYDYEQIKCLISNKKISSQEYHELDDNLIYFYAKQMLKEKDSILSELADRFINRKLLDHVEVSTQKQADSIEKQVSKKGSDPRYFVYKEHLIAEVYKKYGIKDNHEILVLDKNNKVTSLVNASSIVAALDDEAQLKSEQYLVFYKP
jgi:HD superfamily phosphohydrolase